MKMGLSHNDFPHKKRGSHCHHMKELAQQETPFLNLLKDVTKIQLFLCLL